MRVFLDTNILFPNSTPDKALDDKDFICPPN